MALAKVVGIETEYGISGGPDGDPVTASTIAVTSYARRMAAPIAWDFDDESPGRDARDPIAAPAYAPVIETHLANAVLPNGARFYVDHAHPEYSSPECRTPLEATLYDQAGEEVLRLAAAAANADLPAAQRIVIYKNNSDGKGNSYGCHENYLVQREVRFADIVTAMVPHFVSRQIVVGAGKVGSELEHTRGAPPAFQLSQRAEFFEEVVGLETTMRRPIVNTRDEPHGDPARFRRLHVIVGDANLSPVATAVKLGSTALLLAALEDEGLDAFPAPPREPVHAIRAIALDPTLTTTVELSSGASWTAWDLQDRLWELAADYAERTGAGAVAEPDEITFLLGQWREMLDGVRTDRAAVADRIDWVAKHRVLEGFRERHGLADRDPRLHAIDLQYHDVDPTRSLARRVGLRTLHGRTDVVAAVSGPPSSTRAYFRGQCVARYPEEVVAANWDSVVFDVGAGPLHKVPTTDPLRGTADLTAPLFARAPTARDLLAALEG